MNKGVCESVGDLSLSKRGATKLRSMQDHEKSYPQVRLPRAPIRFQWRRGGMALRTALTASPQVNRAAMAAAARQAGPAGVGRDG